MGLAEDIYVAESSEKGGTWSGVIDGLRKGRKILVRQPEQTEKNANKLLIQKGAVSVDFNGNELDKSYETNISDTLSVVNEPEIIETLDEKIRSVFKGGQLSSKEILLKIKVDWSTQKLTNYLKKLEFIEVIKEKKGNLFKIKGTTGSAQNGLFS